MPRCERYFSGLVSGEAYAFFEVAGRPDAAPDAEERRNAEAALDAVDAIYNAAIASIRVALDAYARGWIDGAVAMLNDVAGDPRAEELTRLRLEKPVPHPSALQAIARDLFAAPSADGGPPARFGFDAEIAETDAALAEPPETGPPTPRLGPGEIGALRAATYPFIAMKPRFMDGADLHDPSKDVRLSAYFGVDVTRPPLFRARLTDGLVKLLRPAAAGDPTRAHFEPPRVFVGRSLTHIPLAYAVSDRDISKALAAAYAASTLGALALDRAAAAGLVGDDAPSRARWAERYKSRALRQARSDLKYVFPFPDLLDIDDRYVDGGYRLKQIDPARFRFLPSAVQAEIAELQESFRQLWKRHARDDAHRGARAPIQDPAEPAAREIRKPLTQFGAKRVDYALSRIEHYTGVRVEHFQPYVFFTNYPFYMQAFLSEVFHRRVRSGEGVLIAPIDPERDAPASQRDPERVKELVIGPTPPETVTRLSDPDDPRSARVFDPTRAAAFEPKQMPAVHFAPSDPAIPGMTIVNIGVGPSNAKTMTDMLAVLDARAWLMLGHCGGLRRTQEIGQFVLAHAYVRDDHVLDETLPPSVPIPQMIEVQECLLRAIEEVLLEEDADPESGDQRFVAYSRYKSEVMQLLDALGVRLPDPTRLRFAGADESNATASRSELAAHPILAAAGLSLGSGGEAPAIDPERARAVDAAFRAWRREIRARTRTGTVVSTDDRNWELLPYDEVVDRFGRSKAIAIDMESATIAGAGLRYRIPYGTLLCVSDKPIMGEPKMRGQADEFYETATRNHVRIGLRTVERLFERRDEIARSRKLNGLDDPPLS